MIIYNSKKEFIGIGEKELKLLNLSGLDELIAESSEASSFDFANLFVKTPGYIHNFKHVHWIDFISSEDSMDENRVIISIKGESYKASLELETLYLQENPNATAYGINLVGVRKLTHSENEMVSDDISSQSTPTSAEIKSFDSHKPKTVSMQKSKEVVKDPYEVKETNEVVEEEIKLDLDLEPNLDVFVDEEEKEIKEETLKTTTSQPDVKIDLDLDEEDTISVKEDHKELVEETAELDLEDDEFKDYVYDPALASSELGLPIDLVEEFIEDFINQSYEFKDELYHNLDIGKIDQVRMTSHKLKGVAANLRIEDAYEALVIINTDDDIDKVKRTLDKYYNFIIKKLAGEDVSEYLEGNKSTVASEPAKESPKQEPKEQKLEIKLDDEEEKLDIDFKDEKLDLNIDEEELDIDLDDKELDIKPDEEIEIKLDEDFEIKLDDEIGLKDEPKVKSSDNSDKNKLKSNEKKVILNKIELSSQMGIEQTALDEIFEDYIVDTTLGLEQLRDCIKENDKECVSKLAIRLKGMSDNMRFEPISESFERLLADNSSNKLDIVENISKMINNIGKVA
jgi:hypothetical protein